MERQIFAWDRSKHRLYLDSYRNDWLWILGLFSSAMLLLTIHLGDLPLGDWDEGIIAQVAREIWQAREDSFKWLFPTLWGEPYFSQPPLVTNLIAFTYSLGGVNEWTARLPGALLTAISVPLVYGIGREIFSIRQPAIYAALIYLTGLPVVHSGRLAMVDGAVLCFEVFTLWCALKSRRDLRWSLGIGIGLGLLGLTQGGMGFLMGAIALIFLAWDTPRLLSCAYLWIGILLGSVPLMAWFVAQWLHYGELFLNLGIFQSEIAPSSLDPQAPQFHVLTLLQYAIPALVFCFSGLQLAQENMTWSWAKLVLIWSGLYLLAICLSYNQVSLSLLPLYPALAIAGGAKLAELNSIPRDRAYPFLWTVFFALFALGAMVFGIYFGITQQHDPSLIVIFGAISLTMGMTALLIQQRDSQFIFIFFWGSYVSLLLFVTSPHWNWELQQAYAVKPVANLIQEADIPKADPIYTSFPYERPSLNFYSSRRILTPPSQEIQDLETVEAQDTQSVIPLQALQQEWLQNYWQKSSQPYLLLDLETLESRQLSSVKKIGATRRWILVTKTASL